MANSGKSSPSTFWTCNPDIIAKGRLNIQTAFILSKDSKLIFHQKINNLSKQ
nr:MAG TPA: hypothetical protein [Caudoviricetes sp.]